MGERYVDKGKIFVVHPDVIDAYKNYKSGGFKQMFDERDNLVAQGEPMHNTDHDEEMRQQAADNTDNAICRGWKFPKHARRGQ